MKPYKLYLLNEKIMEQYIRLIIKVELIFKPSTDEETKEEVRKFLLDSITDMMPALKTDYNLEPHMDGFIVQTRTSSSFGTPTSSELSSELGELIKSSFSKLNIVPKTIKKYNIDVETEDIAKETDTF